MNRGGVGARSLNIVLQVALNPAGDRKVERFGWTFAAGDKVMQIENDYDKRSTTATSAMWRKLTRMTANSLPGSTGGRSQTRAKGEPIVKLAALAKSLHSLSVFRQRFPILDVQIGS